MLRVYGDKVNKETGEVLKKDALIFRCIGEADFDNRGKKNAEALGYQITHIWRLGTLANHYRDTKLL